ncbi:MAG TPA: septum formation initiator [Croceicoccus sp.]|nr:septum formation initiator [Croceicoccus sp.]
MAGNNLTQLGKRRKLAARPTLPKRRLGRVAAITALAVLGAMALVGPTGVRAWSESARVLEHRQEQLTELKAEKARIANRVELLDPGNADPDLVGELLRGNLNVAHPDEVVISRED